LQASEQQSSGPSIKCSSVSVSFFDRASQSERKILDRLEMLIPAGNIVALLGQSGCGKSTLLRSVAGLQPIQSGEITVGGQSIESARRSMSFVFQEPALLPWRTAIENVCLPLELQSSIDRAEVHERAKRLLASVGFTADDHDKLPPQLSGGMKMRASLARSLVTEPTLLLLDEPFAALDDMLRWRLNEMLLELCRERSRTVLFVTHNIAEAIFLSQQIAVMHLGKIAQWIENPLPPNRTSELRSTTAFAQFYGQVSKCLSQAGPNKNLLR
jgi:NitT/TauT family transport system ATP-binding protein